MDKENNEREHSVDKAENEDVINSNEVDGLGDHNNINNIEDVVTRTGNKKKTKKSSKMKVFKVILIVLVVLFFVSISVFSTYIFKSGGNITNAVKSIVKDVVGDQDPIFVLVLGVSEDISAELTDTIMLAGYNPDTNKAFVLSIPRDTFIGSKESSAGGIDKINALYQKKPEKTVEAVEKITGINIDYYITVKTSVLVDIVDSIGGVEFDVPIKMDYDDPTQDLHIHLKAGLQKLNGDQAEQLVRFRHNNNGTTYSASYGDNDEGRMRTQREFLKVVAQQIIRTRNVEQIKQVATAIFDNLETNITLNKILGYVPYAIDFNINELQMDQLPGTPEMMNELWFYKVDKDKTENLIESYMEMLGLTEHEKKQYIKEDLTKVQTTNKNTTKNDTTTDEKNTNTTKNTKKTNTNTTKNTKKTNTNNTNKSKSTTKKSNNVLNNTKPNNNSINTNNTTKNVLVDNGNTEEDLYNSKNDSENKNTNQNKNLENNDAQNENTEDSATESSSDNDKNKKTTTQDETQVGTNTNVQ